jgi:hypothetical protein
VSGPVLGAALKSEKANWEIVKVLLEAGAYPDVKRKRLSR